AFMLKQRALLNELAFRLEKARQEKSPDKASIEALIEAAEGLEYDDPGPQYDVVAYQDSDKKWWVIVDVSETGDLSSQTPLCDFKLERKWGTLGYDCHLAT